MTNSNLIDEAFTELQNKMLSITDENKWPEMRDEKIHEFVKRILKLRDQEIEGSELLDFIRESFDKGFKTGITTSVYAFKQFLSNTPKSYDQQKFNKFAEILCKTKESDYEKIETFVDKLSEGGGA